MNTDHTRRRHPLPRHDCRLCGDRHGRVREGRLGRYRITCDDCAARRGSHLVRTDNGYAARGAARAGLPLAG